MPSHHRGAESTEEILNSHFDRISELTAKRFLDAISIRFLAFASVLSVSLPRKVAWSSWRYAPRITSYPGHPSERLNLFMVSGCPEGT